MQEATERNDELEREDTFAFEERDPRNDPLMTLVVVGCMLLLVLVIAAIMIADRRPPAGL